MAIDWSKIRESRGNALRKLKPLTKYPIVPSGEHVLVKSICSGDKVLDVGAHNRRLHKLIQRQHPEVEYRSLDLDRSMPHDYYAFADVSERFDVAALFDVIEHCSPEAVSEMFDAIHRVLQPAGRLVITTPNVAHPNRLWRDCTHITPWIYYEICGFLEASGFEVSSIHRIRQMSLKDRLAALILTPVTSFLEIDHTYGIVVTAIAGNPVQGR